MQSFRCAACIFDVSLQSRLMELQLQIKMNPALYVRDPETSDLGKKIVTSGIKLIYELGFEDFTFKKLAVEIGTTEASVYRYFENKHRLLTYLTTWFWTWMEYLTVFHTNNLKSDSEKIAVIIRLLTLQDTDVMPFADMDKKRLHSITISEGNKAYFTRHVTADNEAQMFKPYKDLCHRIAEVFLHYKAGYPYPHSLASTLVETAHHQLYFKDNLPRLTDFGGKKGMQPLLDYLNHLVFCALDGWKPRKR